MKFVLLVVVVLLVLWIARAARRRSGASRGSPPSPPQAHEDMVACSHCGMHLPRSEALPGRGGLFCGEGHRAEHERADAGGR